MSDDDAERTSGPESLPLTVGSGRPLLGLKRLTVGNIMSGSSAFWFSRAASVTAFAPCTPPFKSGRRRSLLDEQTRHVHCESNLLSCTLDGSRKK